MKKLIVLMMALTFVLAACGSSTSNETVNVPVSDITAAILEKAQMHNSVDQIDLKGEDTGIAEMLNIAPGDLAEGMYVKAMINVKADELILLKAADESKIDTLKQALEAEGNAQEQNWSRYLPSQYEIVKNRLIKQNGLYLMLFIGENTDAAEQTFDTMLKAE